MHDHPEYWQLKRERREAFTAMIDARRERNQAQDQCLDAEAEQEIAAYDVLYGPLLDVQEAKRWLAECKRNTAEARRAYRKAKGEYEKRVDEYSDAKTALERIVKDRAGIPRRYLPSAKMRFREGEYHIYFGGRGDKADGDDHGHAIINRKGVLRYRRNPGAPHGSHNHIDTRSSTWR